MGLKGEISEQIEVANGKIGTLSEQMQVQAKTTDTNAETLAALPEQITALNKNISSIQGDVTRWKEQDQQFAVEKEEMYDAEEVFPTSSSTPTIDLITDSTSPARKLQPIYEIEENPILFPSLATSNFAPS